MSSTPKEYNLLFKLSAELGREFGGTFQTAQKQLTETQKEIRELNNLQRDISAYQKQQQTVVELTKKQSLLASEYDILQRKTKETSNASAALEISQVRKKAALEDTAEACHFETLKLERMKNALNEAGIDTEQLGAESEKLKAQIGSLADEQSKLADESEEAGIKGKSALQMVGDALISAGVAKGLKEIYDFTIDCAKGSALYADNILTMSAQYNIAEKDLQAYYYAAELVDVSIDTITSSISKNTRSMYSAADGSKQYVEAYEELGISVTDANGNIRDGMTVYWEVIDALGALENETERDGIAMTLLGRSAMQLNTLIKAGSGVMEEYAEEAQKAGYILSEDVLAVCGKLDDAEQKQKNNLTALKNTIGAQFAPELTAVTELGNDILAGLTSFVNEHPALVKGVAAITAELGIALALYKGIPAAMALVNTAKSLNNALKAKSAVLTTADAAASTADAAAKTAQSAATKAATGAQAGLNAVMAVSPIGIIITGITALTALYAIFSDVFKSENEQLTAASRAQYEELQLLNKEYEETCKLYGEASDEAKELHGELLLAEEEFNSSKKTQEQFNAEIQNAVKSYDEFTAAHNKAIAEIGDEEDIILALIGKLSALEAQTGKTQQEKIKLAAIVDQLNEKLPSLGLAYNSVTNSLNMTADAIHDIAKAEIERKKNEQNYRDYTTAVESELEQEKLLAEAKRETTAAQKALDEAIDYNAERHGDVWNDQKPIKGLKERLNTAKKNQAEIQAAYDKALADQQSFYNAMKLYHGEINSSGDAATEKSKKLASALIEVRSGYVDVESAAKRYGVSAEALQNELDGANEYKKKLESALKAITAGYYTAIEAAEAFGVTESAINITSSIEESLNALEELSEMYHEVKSSAQNSIEGQYDLWDTAAIVIPTSILKINASLETQLGYWEDYNYDLQALLSRSEDVEGLSELIASLPYGTADSVNAIAGMANASDDELKQMVEMWKSVNAEQERVSSTIAEIAYGFTDEFELAKNDLASAVEGLTLNDEAAEAARNTVTAYVEAIQSGTDDAVAAAERLALLVSDALRGGAENAQAFESLYTSSRGDISMKYTRAVAAYASGTESALPGIALVGENGPELVEFEGGERVFNTYKTYEALTKISAVQSPISREGIGGTVYITVSPSFTVGENTDDIGEKLHEFSDELIVNVLEALEEAGIDARRGVYS